jgi:hypothetical protein
MPSSSARSRAVMYELGYEQLERLARSVTLQKAAA